MSLRLKFAIILLLAVVTAMLAYPREDKIFKLFGIKNATLQVKEGLDLQGGAQLVFQADLSKTAAADRDKTMSSLLTVIQRRVSGVGTSETQIQRVGSDRISVSLPGVKNVTDAINTIGKTADLQFFIIDATTGAQSPTDVSGKDVDSATADYDPTTSQPIVQLNMKSGDSTKRFSDLTTQLSQSGNLLLTDLDGQPTFGPARTSAITNGKAQLSGNLTVKQAQEIASQITAGALPVNITLVAQNTVGPSLGRDSVSHSLVAGLIGLSIVAIFMLAYYRLAGAVAVVALFIYTTITLSLYKLSSLVPGYTIVLTLAGIAGFILSIGMAVDANILIFERFKEELRAGKSYVAALEAAFDRAWTSIRDSNMSTLITCAILYLTSSSTPIIRGFAVTLGLGVLVSLFTSVVITRTLMRLVIRQRWGRGYQQYALKENEVAS
ncbi:protein translocase subunit SecD [Candidatus Saccharibacteria bacterium]|nr:protein translocase subunit SecD [Candidatus Saccharibacteria bacterium]